MKKVLSMALVLTLLITCLSCGSVFAAVDAETVLVDEDFSEATAGTYAPVLSDFTSNAAKESGLSIVTDDTAGYGEALKKTSGSSTTNTYTYTLTNAISSGTVVVSFDTRADYSEITSNTGNGSTENFGFYFTVGSRDASVFRTISAFSDDVYAMQYGTDYEAYAMTADGKSQNSKWVHVDLVYDCQTYKMTYYVNGASYGSEYTLKWKTAGTETSNPTVSGNLAAIKFRAVSSAPNTTYLDNLKIVHNPGSMSATVKADSDKSYIDVKFNKTLEKTPDFSGVTLVNAGTYEEVAVTASKLTSDTVRLAFEGNLDAAKDYVVTFPSEVASAFGDSFKGEIPFVTETTAKTTYINEDFENIPAMGENDYAPTISGWTLDTVSGKTSVSINEFSDGTHALLNAPNASNGGNYKVALDPKVDGKLTISFDTWTDSELTADTSVPMQITLMDESHSHYVLRTTNRGSNTNKYTVEAYKGGDTSSTSNFNQIKLVGKDTKIHVEMVYDAETNTVKYYIDGVYQTGSDLTLSALNGKVCKVYFINNKSTKVNAYLDNVVIKQESVTSAIESVGYVTADGTVYGGVVGKGVSALKVKFNKAFDEEDISKVTLTAGGEDVSYTASYSDDKTELTLTAAIDADKNCVLTVPVGSETRSYAFTTAASGKATLDKVTCETSGSDLKVKVCVTDTESAKGNALMLVKVTDAQGKVTTVRAYSVNLGKGSNVFEKTLSGVSGTKAEAFFVNGAADLIPVI